MTSMSRSGTRTPRGPSWPFTVQEGIPPAHTLVQREIPDCQLRSPQLLATPLERVWFSVLFRGGMLGCVNAVRALLRLRPGKTYIQITPSVSPESHLRATKKGISVEYRRSASGARGLSGTVCGQDGRTRARHGRHAFSVSRRDPGCCSRGFRSKEVRFPRLPRMQEYPGYSANGAIVRAGFDSEGGQCQHGLGAGVYPQFAEDLRHVGLDGGFLDVQFVSDLLV